MSKTSQEVLNESTAITLMEKAKLETAVCLILGALCVYEGLIAAPKDPIILAFTGITAIWFGVAAYHDAVCAEAFMNQSENSNDSYDDNSSENY